MTSTTGSPERLQSLVRRLEARQQWDRAARLFGSWLARCEVEPDPEPSRLTWQWMRYGYLLRRASRHVEAATAYRRVIALDLAGSSTSRTLLSFAFKGLADSCEAGGLPLSAKETRELGERVIANMRVDDDPLMPLSPARLVRPAASRCTFILSIHWQQAGDSFEVSEEDGLLILRDRMSLSDQQPALLDFELKAPVEADTNYPHIAVRVGLPWRFVQPDHVQAALEVVNAMNNENAACSCCLEAETGQIAVRSRIAFSAWNEVTKALDEVSHAQQEATVNMLLEVIGTADGWSGRVADLADRLGIAAGPELR